MIARFKEDHRRLFADKVVDADNTTIGALVFGRILCERGFFFRVNLIGLILSICGYRMSNPFSQKAVIEDMPLISLEWLLAGITVSIWLLALPVIVQKERKRGPR